jgi:EAL domain-containing protein (putative c-di-GMP-specific phosphodiesterase class I)
MTETPPSSSTVRWCLESLANGGKTLRRVLICPLPFRIGRRSGVNLNLPSTSVSKDHAEILQEGDELRVRDLRSTNGTFVNRTRVDSAPIREGDIVHFADYEFRLGKDDGSVEASVQESTEETQTVAMRDLILPHQFVEGTRELAELLQQNAVTPYFQPIVKLDGVELAAYEVLGRGIHPGLPESPGALFHIAESVGAEARLSQLFIRKALETVSHCTDLPPLFLNTHPAEIDDPDLPKLIADLALIAPQIKIVLEFHEAVLDNLPRITTLREELSAVGIDLAYDDFGSGRARLLELADVPPDYLKFDIRLIREIDRAPASRLRLISSFVEAARDLEIKTIAEGIERQEEAMVCTQLGFIYGQGYFFGRPKPFDSVFLSA